MSLINEALHNLDERQGASVDEVIEARPAVPPPKPRSSFARWFKGTLWIAAVGGLCWVVWTTNPAAVLQVQSEAEAIADNLLDEAVVVFEGWWGDKEAPRSAVQPQSDTSSLRADNSYPKRQGGEAKAATIAANAAAVKPAPSQAAKPQDTPVSTAQAATVAANTAAVTPAPSQAAKPQDTPIITAQAATVAANTAAVTPAPSQTAKPQATPVNTGQAATVAANTAAVPPAPSQTAKPQETPISTVQGATLTASTAAVTPAPSQTAKPEETPVSTVQAATVSVNTAAVTPAPSQTAKPQATPVSTAQAATVAANTAAVTSAPSQTAKPQETPVRTVQAATVAAKTAVVTPTPSQTAKPQEMPVSTAQAATVAANTAATSASPERTAPLASAPSQTGQTAVPPGNVAQKPVPVPASGDAAVVETPAAASVEISAASAALDAGAGAVQRERPDEVRPERTPLLHKVQAAATPKMATNEIASQEGKSTANPVAPAADSGIAVTRAEQLVEAKAGGNAASQAPAKTKSVATVVTAGPNASAQRNGSALQTAADTAQLQQLLRKAQAALEENRLTLPVGRSAYDYYNAALRHSPSNVTARRGLEELPAQYERLIRQQIARGDTQRARFYLARYKKFGWMPSASLMEELELSAAQMQATPEMPPAGTLNQPEVVGRNPEPSLDLVTLRKLATVNGDAFVVARLEDAAGGDVKTLPRRHREYLLELYIKTGSREKAAALLASSGDHTNETRLLKAQFYYRFASLQRAISYLAPTAAGNEKLVAYLAALYQKAGEFQAALDTYQSLLLDDPANGRYLLGYALAADSLGADLAAIDAYARALSSGTQGPSTEGFIRQRLAALR